jgi:hypothetical protein
MFNTLHYTSLFKKVLSVCNHGLNALVNLVSAYPAACVLCVVFHLLHDLRH